MPLFFTRALQFYSAVTLLKRATPVVNLHIDFNAEPRNLCECAADASGVNGDNRSSSNSSCSSSNSKSSSRLRSHLEPQGPSTP